MQIDNNSNVNFTARLDLSRVTSNKRMWSNVADMFEAKTKKIPYTFRLDNSCDELVIQADTILKSGYDPEHDVIISKKAKYCTLQLCYKIITLFFLLHLDHLHPFFHLLIHLQNHLLLYIYFYLL